jgi:hypothetical protein
MAGVELPQRIHRRSSLTETFRAVAQLDYTMSGTVCSYLFLAEGLLPTTALLISCFSRLTLPF